MTGWQIAAAVFAASQGVVLLAAWCIRQGSAEVLRQGRLVDYEPGAVHAN